jgi:hypothetical protein
VVITVQDLGIFLVYLGPGSIACLLQYILCFVTKKRWLRLIPVYLMLLIVIFPFFFWNEGMLYYVFRYTSWCMLFSAIIGDVLGWVLSLSRT